MGVADGRTVVIGVCKLLISETLRTLEQAHQGSQDCTHTRADAHYCLEVWSKAFEVVDRHADATK